VVQSICDACQSHNSTEFCLVLANETCGIIVILQAGVHPEQPGHTVGREAFDRIWHHSVLLLQRGFREGGILTVDAEEAKVLGNPWTRRWVLASTEPW